MTQREGEKQTPTSIYGREAAQGRVGSGRQTRQQSIVPRIATERLQAALERVGRAVQQEGQHLCAHAASHLARQLAASCPGPPATTSEVKQIWNIPQVPHF